MKKAFIYFSILACLALGGLWGAYKFVFHPAEIVIHVRENEPSEQINKLMSALKKEGKDVVLAVGAQNTSGTFNLYTAADIDHLPAVVDAEAINFLWIDRLKSDANPEPLRPFDVIVVKNMPAYKHLKATNVRTAFIPEAIDIADTESALAAERPMFWGDGKEFSVSLLLAGGAKVQVDVYGEGFEGKWPREEIRGTSPEPAEFRRHPLVLADQSDEEIVIQSLNPRILKIIENGGVPFVLYNPVFEKLFGKAVPMYFNGDEFMPKLQQLLQNYEEIEKRRNAIRHLSNRWNSHSQALKFMELFEIMDKKRR